MGNIRVPNIDSNPDLKSIALRLENSRNKEVPTHFNKNLIVGLTGDSTIKKIISTLNPLNNKELRDSILLSDSLKKE